MKVWQVRSFVIALYFAQQFSIRLSCAQDLTPRAYLITPVHSNAIVLTYSFFAGNIEFAGAVPITGATARTNVPIVSIYHAFNLFGRSSNFTASLPYGIGTFRGTVVGAETTAYRSGLLALSFRLSINLLGGRAMNVSEFAQWHQKRILGASFRLLPLSGQYDPTKLVNLGTNRWAFRPEIGYSQRWAHWILDVHGGGWVFSMNSEFLSRIQTQRPIGSIEGHLSYDFKPRLWFSLDSNFWFGGSTKLDGVGNSATAQRNSRVGMTSSIPLSRHQSLKISYNNGAYTKYGGNFQNISVAWQYSWLGRPN
jgi:hypothetical protein